MISTLTDFHLHLNEIKKLIEYFETEKKLLSNFQFSNSNNDLILNEVSKKLKDFRISKLKFNYNSIIISLYGIFERFIENCLSVYIERINGIVKEYHKLPDIILKHHLTLSLSLLNKVEQPRYNGYLSKEIIINNLHTCINNVNAYQLNKEAFAQHSANFRLQVIDDNFNQVGIEQLSKKILKTDSFTKFLIEKKGLAPNSSELDQLENLQPLNDLAEWRNFVAHGIDNQIIENNTLLDYIDFYEAFSQALFEVANKNLLNKRIEYNGIQLGKITDVFPNRKAVCFYTNGKKISIGQIIIGQNTTNTISSVIKNIQVNGTNFNTVAGENIEISIEVDGNFKKNFKLYIFDDPV
jgi:hypothetical protein